MDERARSQHAKRGDASHVQTILSTFDHQSSTLAYSISTEAIFLDLGSRSPGKVSFDDNTEVKIFGMVL